MVAKTKGRTSRGRKALHSRARAGRLIHALESALTGVRVLNNQPMLLRIALPGIGEIELRTGELEPAFSGPVAKAERVKNAERLLAEAGTYTKGCSEFVCKVLDISYELANELMGSPTVRLGTPNEQAPWYDFSGIVAGDIVGWKAASGSGHVAVYVGNERFVDVREPAAKPRKLGRWADNNDVFKSSRFG